MKKMILGFAAMALMMVACQSNSFKVNGVAEGFNDGDTLFFMEEIGGAPSSTLIVKDGKFTLQGEVDSVTLCSITDKDGASGVIFFREPGTINITLKNGAPSTVGGTPCNDGWQELNNVQAAFSEKTDKMVEQLYTEELDSAQQASIVAQVEAAHKELTDKIMATAEKNISNELGLFILSSLAQNPETDPAKIRQLIGMMPADLQQRPAIVDILTRLELQEQTAVGKTIPDFTMATPDGGELNVMSEVAKNKVTLLDFWASWCGPCRQEMPFMVALYGKYKDKGLGIVGISLDKDHDSWTKAIGELGITWPQISDLKYWQSEAAEMFQVQAIPHVIVVDQQGVILNRGIRGEELENFIASKL
mgnify:CR=1 FL=1